MRKIFLFCLIQFFFISFQLFAQGEAAVPFVCISPSPGLNGLASAATALPSDDPIAFYYNPAQLGNFSRDKNLGYSFYWDKMRWLPAFNFNDLTFDSRVLALGYNFSRIYPKLPLSIGVGLIHTKLDLGVNVWTDEQGNYLGTFNSWEEYRGFSIGVGFDWLIRMQAGFTFKNIESNLSDISVGAEGHDGIAKVSASDFGTQATLPVVNLFSLFVEEPSFKELGVIPHFDLSLGYALTNVGGKVIYNDWTQVDPLPRQAKIGYALSTGLKQNYFGHDFSLFQFEWSLEANDLLIKKDSAGISRYTDAPGEIDFWNHLIKGRADDRVQVNQGWRLQFLESFLISSGSFKGPGYPEMIETEGFVFTTKGIFKLLSGALQNDVAEQIARHLELQYVSSKYLPPKDHPLIGTRYEGVSILVHGF